MIRAQAVYASGVLRPLAPLPLQENQTVALTIENATGRLDELVDWELLADCQSDPDDAPSIDEVRRTLASCPGSLSAAVIADREESRF